MSLTGIILAGGAARRLSGVDKVLLETGGISLLQRAIDALAGADEVVVVGPRRDAISGVHWTQEQPPRSGPLAALKSGLDAVEHADTVAVLAADLAGVRRATIDRLRAALEASDVDGTVLVDETGHRQWLLGVWRRDALRNALPADPVNKSVRRTLSELRVGEVPAEPGEAADVDTPDDLHSSHTGRQAP